MQHCDAHGHIGSPMLEHLGSPKLERIGSPMLEHFGSPMLEHIGSLSSHRLCRIRTSMLLKQVGVLTRAMHSMLVSRISLDTSCWYLASLLTYHVCISHLS